MTVTFVIKWNHHRDDEDLLCEWAGTPATNDELHDPHAMCPADCETSTPVEERVEVPDPTDAEREAKALRDKASCDLDELQARNLAYGREATEQAVEVLRGPQDVGDDLVRLVLTRQQIAWPWRIVEEAISDQETGDMIDAVVIVRQRMRKALALPEVTPSGLDAVRDACERNGQREFMRQTALILDRVDKALALA